MTALEHTLADVSEAHRECAVILAKLPEEKGIRYEIVLNYFSLPEASCICNGARNLFDAAKSGCGVCCKKFMEQRRQTKNDIHIEGWPDAERRTALMVAAYYGRANIVGLLRNSEAGMKDGYRNTALVFAVSMGNVQCAKMLVDKEGRMQNNDRGSALMYAAMIGNLACVQLLAEKEAGLENV